MGLYEFDKHNPQDADSVKRYAEQAVGYHADAYDLAKDNNLSVQQAYSAGWCAEMHAHLENREEASTLYDEARQLHEQVGNLRGLAFSTYHAAGFAVRNGDLVRAEQLANDALPQFIDIGSDFHVAITYDLLGNILEGQSTRITDAVQSYQLSLQYHYLVNEDSPYLSIILNRIASLQTITGHYADAARMYGAAEAAINAIAGTFPGGPEENTRHTGNRDTCRDKLGEASYSSAFSGGAAVWKKVVTDVFLIG